ncbi:unnamed protein product, partial [Adineta steineri]
MGNYLPNFRGNTDHGTRETKRRAGWLPVAVTTNVSMIFATDLSSAVGETVSNDDSLSTQ